MLLLERLKRDWDSPIYAFFRPQSAIGYEDGRRYLDKGDATSTSNLRKHVKKCWGEETLSAADRVKNVADARDIMTQAQGRDGSITAVFMVKGKGMVTYSHRQHTKTEAK